MWARLWRAWRRLALVIPVALTVAVLLILPRPGPPSHPKPTSSSEDQPSDESLKWLLEEGYVPRRPTLESQAANEVLRPWFFRGGILRPWSTEPDDSEPNMFPEDAPMDDRIIDQLFYALPKEEQKYAPIKKILLANGMSAWGRTSGQIEFIKNRCPVDKCTLTADARDAATADAILFKDHHTLFNVKRPINQIWILYYLECPYHTASLRPTSFDVFNWTATYRRDSDIVAPYERWVPYDPSVTQKEVDRNYAANKTKKVAWFVSNCHARNRRLQYARQLSKYISVDIYGACGSHHCPRADPNCLEMLDRDYKFYLAFENSNCRDYITEKFFVNGLQHDVIPIVMGARPNEYAAVAPHNSYIHVEEFAGPEDLAAYLHRLDQDDTLYNSYFKWKGTGEFINTYFFCRLCAMLHANDIRRRTGHYTDVQAWWREGACTRGDWRPTSKPPTTRKPRIDHNKQQKINNNNS